MHRDVKIGLILGVLLVALVAALFFRRESPQQLPPSPPLTPVVARAEQSSQPLHHQTLVRPLSDASGPIQPRPSGQETSVSAAPTRSGGDATTSTGVSERTRSNTDPSDRLVPLGPGAASRSEQPVSELSPWEVAPGGPPIASSPTRHRIQSGDTLWWLAEQYLGDGARADELYQANLHVLSDPDRLPVGVEIIIPRSADGAPTSAGQTRESDGRWVSLAETPSAAGMHDPPAVVRSFSADRKGTGSTQKVVEPGAHRLRQYTVRPGDTLRRIARDAYRDESRWREIYQANRSVLDDPDMIHAGTVLRLP